MSDLTIPHRIFFILTFFIKDFSALLLNILTALRSLILNGGNRGSLSPNRVSRHFLLTAVDCRHKDPYLLLIHNRGSWLTTFL